MTQPPDFEELRRQRNEAVERILDETCARLGWDRGKATVPYYDPNACYCDCANGGPCEHKFTGWREFEDGRGGEQVCERCGLGAMSHSLRTAP